MGKRSYTDEQLREAVARSSCLSEVIRHLGMCVCTDNRVRIRQAIAELGLDDSHLRRTVHSHTNDHLRAAVARASTLADVCRALGLVPAGGNYTTLREEIERLGLDTTHFQRPLMGGRYSSSISLSDDEFRKIVAESVTVSEAVRKAGLLMVGNSHKTVKEHIFRLGIDMSHFKHGRRSYPSIEEILVSGRSVSTHHLKRRLIKEGIKERICETCQRTEWMGRPIPLELDHVNGDRSDNRIENLRLICPNCHAMTETYRGRNIGRSA